MHNYPMLPEGYEKRSFYRFDIGLELERLRQEYAQLTDEDWQRSYWGNVHCSIGMLMLRGGDKGTSEDYFADSVSDSSVLASLPYIRSLISESGPFGEANYAFLFRMEAGGVTLKHRDLMEQWRDLYRIHIPIITNPGAHLISKYRSIHFAEGYAWSFDNFADHGVVNGDEERIHLIFDVPFSQRMKEAIDNAEVIKGKENIEHTRAIDQKVRSVPSYPGDEAIKESVDQLRLQGLDNGQIAEVFNQKGIPTKLVKAARWQPEMIDGYS